MNTKPYILNILKNNEWKIIEYIGSAIIFELIISGSYKGEKFSLDKLYIVVKYCRSSRLKIKLVIKSMSWLKKMMQIHFIENNNMT